jgi:hypothetical protein
VPRLFISHTSKDSIHALAFRRWLVGKGWGEDDIFIDLHDMQAGEKWRETLVKANVACDALLFLASPDALESDECKREVRRAEDDRKDVIVAILRDVRLDDPRLKPWMDRQIMDLSADPLEERVEVEHQARRHFISFNRLALEAIHAKLIDWGHAPDSFAWPPKERPNAQSYPGLDAFDEHSAGIFFGRRPRQESTMPLSGQAKTDYQRGYMARRRAAEHREARKQAKAALPSAKSGGAGISGRPRRSRRQTGGNWV